MARILNKTVRHIFQLFPKLLSLDSELTDMEMEDFRKVLQVCASVGQNVG
jgi:hypothetical protein